MSAAATFLHITDMHVAAAGVPFMRDSVKVALPAVPAGTRQEAVELLFKRVAERLAADKITLDGVLFSGDAQDQAKVGGHEFVLKQLKDHLGPLGLPLSNVVSVPGNHDVSRATPPSSRERYQGFLDVWRNAGCVVPWLDGVDPGPRVVRPEQHRLVAADASWAIYPINTSNWSNVTRLLPDRLHQIWHAIPTRSANGDDELAALIKNELDSFTRFDMPRVSKEQLEALRAIVASTPAPQYGEQVRIAVMHHHLRSPGLSEELKPFADMSNLEQVRAFLRDSRMDLVLHGHKHEQAAYYEYVTGDDRTQRMLVVSGGTFDVGREQDAVRLITLDGLPYAPQVRIEPIPLPRAGASSAQVEPVVRRLWSANTQALEGVAAGLPIMIEGSDLDQVYARALDLAKSDAKRGILIIHLDLPDDDGKTLPLPRAYPVPPDVGTDERQAWLRDLVEWWQLGRSQLEARIPYLHGARLRRYGGKIDQIARIIALLETKPSTRALAVLVDPFRDFTLRGDDEEFASFCLVEFRRRDADANHIVVDAIAFYRAQEFTHWWPINVAELRFLQREICAALGFRPGRITTIAADSRTTSRSPTQVSMPIVDRWLDKAPERIHLLADALLYKEVAAGAEAAVREWHRTLSEQRLATEAFNPDGLPLAIEGLSVLAAYIEATAQQDDDEIKRFAEDLRNLANLNELLDQQGWSRDAFNKWAPVAQSTLARLGTVSTSRLRTAPGLAAPGS